MPRTLLEELMTITSDREMLLLLPIWLTSKQRHDSHSVFHDVTLAAPTVLYETIGNFSVVGHSSSRAPSCSIAFFVSAGILRNPTCNCQFIY